jgi:hypothetical protein
MNLNYSFRFGLIFGIASLIVGIILMNGGESGPLLLIVTHAIVALPILLLLVYGLGYQSSSSNEDILIVVIGTIMYIVIGIIIGWVYGKIKNRRQEGTITR